MSDFCAKFAADLHYYISKDSRHCFVIGMECKLIGKEKERRGEKEEKKKETNNAI